MRLQGIDLCVQINLCPDSELKMCLMISFRLGGFFRH